jgi:hypothetical protein
MYTDGGMQFSGLHSRVRSKPTHEKEYDEDDQDDADDTNAAVKPKP